jgi:hypothetical protein
MVANIIGTLLPTVATGNCARNHSGGADACWNAIRRSNLGGLGKFADGCRASSRDLALFNLAIGSKLRGCDVAAVKVEDVAPNASIVAALLGQQDWSVILSLAAAEQVEKRRRRFDFNICVDPRVILAMTEVGAKEESVKCQNNRCARRPSVW